MSTSLRPTPGSPVTRTRRLAILGIVAAALAVLVGLLVGAFAPSLSSASVPGTQDGVIAEGAPASVDDTSLPAIARLDPALRDALRAADSAARADGVRIRISSGWRNDAYQRRLFEDAVKTYRSEDGARQFVATPEKSAHVTGHAVDVAPLEAQLWLQQHGSRFGLCQIYANERWHYERATSPGRPCPPMRRDAEG